MQVFKLYFTVIEHKTLYGLRVHSHNIPQCIYTAITTIKATTNKNPKHGLHPNEE